MKDKNEIPFQQNTSNNSSLEVIRLTFEVATAVALDLIPKKDKHFIDYQKVTSSNSTHTRC